LLQPHIADKVATSPLDIISLSISLMFGTAGLPHILMRFYTVPDAREARKSVFYATGFIGYFYILTFTIGYGAAALVAGKFLAPVEKGGMTSNVAAPLLAEILGGAPFLGFLCAVAFATILAVVAGLTLAGATALSHDIYVGVLRHGEPSEKDEVRVARYATVALGVLAVLLGLGFKSVNVAFMVGLAFAVAASANFPALLLSVMWKKCTTAGAVAAMVTGLVLSVVLIVLSPTVWTDVFHFTSTPPFPMKSPALISMPASFIVCILVSLLKPEPEAAARFDDEKLRTFAGIGAE
jgi:cation/acetate symporter